MKSRCTNVKLPDYKNWGGRGIGYDPKWEQFDGFVEDMFDSYSEGLTLDRKDNDIGYSKENCAWVDRRAQANNRRSNHKVTMDGRTQNLEQWIMELGLRSSTVRQRIFGYRWPAVKALTYAR